MFINTLKGTNKEFVKRGFAVKSKEKKKKYSLKQQTFTAAKVVEKEHDAAQEPQIKAEELATTQKEISVSEFFAKNRHLLGFDNPARALLMTVKEAVDNSLTYDMPLVTRYKGKTSIIKIGKLIDQQFAMNKEGVAVMRDGDLERLQLKQPVEVLSFDKDNLRLSFRQVSCLFRHKVNSAIYRVQLVSGRYVDLTAHHSVFTIKEGSIISIPTTELKIGTPVVVPKTKWGIKDPVREINLIEELLHLDRSLTARINVYGINNLLTEEIISRIKSVLPQSKHYKIQDFRKCNYLPLWLVRQLPTSINQFTHCKLGYSFSRYKIPALLRIDYNLAELFGVYIAEGSMLKSLYRVHFSFGSHERAFVYYTVDLFEKVFRFRPRITKAHDSAYNVVANCSILCFILKYIFRTGEYANTKRVPDIVFEFPHSLKQSFLLAYLAGDGHPTKDLFFALKNDLLLDDLQIERITSATASSELHMGLQYLLSSIGISYSIGLVKSKERVINHVRGYFGKSYYIYVYTKSTQNAINFLPINETIVHVSDRSLRRSFARQNQLNAHTTTIAEGIQIGKLEAYPGVQTILRGDLGVLRIKKIEKIVYCHPWVYDLSVPECENFVAGVGAIVCHNSLDACTEMKVLPEVIVQVKQSAEGRYNVSIEDNGPGIVKKQIPRVFGKLLYGSKFHRRVQSRGQQGIGISASVLYAQLTTGKVTKITSKIHPKKPAHYYELQIDTKRNEPKILIEKEVEWKKEHGTKVELELEGKYQKGKQSVDEFIKQAAIVNPHAKFVFLTPDNENVEFPRVVTMLPVEAKEIKPHPYGIEVGTLIRMLEETTSRTLQGFLTNDFCRIGSGTAKEICDKALLQADYKPQSVTHQEAERLFKVMRETKIIAPPLDCLSPIGETELEKGLRKEIQADFYVAITRPPTVYRGFPFQIECAIAYGGTIDKESAIRLMRFANRVPLLYQQGACAITEAVQETNWKPYGLQQSGDNLPVGPAAIVVHMASVWVPFTSEAKDALAHYPDIMKEIKLALQEAGRKLGIFINKKRRLAEAEKKRSYLEKYLPHIGEALKDILALKETEEKKVVYTLKEELERAREV